MKGFLFGFVLSVVSVTASASTVDQLRQRLGEFRGLTALAGKIDIVQEASRGKKRTTRNASAEFECDHAALRVTVSGAELSRAARPGAPDDTSRIDLEGLWERLNVAPALLNELDKAKMIAAQASTWKGHPATRLEVSVTPERPEDVPRMLKLHADMRRVYWIASDGTPLSSEWRATFSARFLLISASGENKQIEEYEVIGDRLVIVREVDQGRGAALGEKGGQTTTTTLTLNRTR